MIGQALAHYEILGKFGSGGMGEVYRARDTKLKRDVAIKVLSERFAGDRERMARFEREARVLASLNHPNIAAIYGLEETDGVFALVMELVEGETLAQRIERGALELEEAIDIATQIAAGLDAAHAKGIIHRDLKPANVMITEDGTVKVLDFGLAKALEGDAAESVEDSNSPTLSRAATQAGVLLGTAGYMSPEASTRKARRQKDRYLGARRRAVRDADRNPPIPWRNHVRHPRSGSQDRTELDSASGGDTLALEASSAPVPREESSGATSRRRGRATGASRRLDVGR